MAQFVRPTSDIATGGWSSTPLWSKVDEGSPGDGTTIVSDNNTAPDNADFGCSDATDPSSSTNHILRAAWNKDASGGHAINAVLELWQGTPGTGTLIATLSVTGIGDVEQEDSYTLSAGEADSITDYAALNLRLSRQGDTGGSPNGRRSLVADFVEMELPDASLSLQPTHFQDGDSFGAADVSPGPVDLAPTHVSDADSFGSPQADHGLTAAKHDDPDSFGAADVSPGPATLSPSHVDDADSFGAHTVSTEGGSQTLSPTKVDDADSFGAPSVGHGLTATKVEEADTFGSPQVSLELSATKHDDPDTFGAHTLEGGEESDDPPLFLLRAGRGGMRVRGVARLRRVLKRR